MARILTLDSVLQLSLKPPDLYPLCVVPADVRVNYLDELLDGCSPPGAIVKSGVRGFVGMIRRLALEEPVCFQSPGFRP
jgi:hypothetical protein